MINRKSIWFILVKGKYKRLMGHTAYLHKVLCAFVFYTFLIFFKYKERKFTEYTIYTAFISRNLSQCPVFPLT